MPSSTSIKPVTHCIFDMDGLLLDTEKIIEVLMRDVCESFGKELSPELRLKVMGQTEQVTCQTIVEEAGLPISAKEFAKRCEDVKQLKKAELMKGVDKLVRHLHASKIPICVATSGSKEMTEVKISSHEELFKLFDHIVCGSTDPEVIHGKPAPDIFLVAAQRFPDKPDPSKCLVFEDSKNGVLAAISANMQVVMVPDKILPKDFYKGATIVLNSLEDFQPELFGLPKYDA